MKQLLFGQVFSIIFFHAGTLLFFFNEYAKRIAIMEGRWSFDAKRVEERLKF